MSMEKAEYAMRWSIELEKGLRSKKPGRSMESIREIGLILKQWSGQPLTKPVCDMFGLSPGEDRLFGDVILLRLADAFVSGDRVIRICVIKVFLSALRSCKRKDGRALGIFSNISTEIRIELLRKVKVVLSADSVESRALTLILFGCWANIAKDSAEVAHVVLSSLSSCHILEVKASLFAAGCFSEISDGFGTVFLEKLTKLMMSPDTMPSVKSKGARAYSRMTCSVMLASKAYKAGAELVQKCLEEDILALMLISLTKLSIRASILVSELVGLLCAFLAQKTTLDILTIIVRCISYIGENAACLVPISSFPFQALFRIFDEPSTPSTLRREVLQIFLKINAFGLPDTLPIDANEFKNYFRCIEESTRSSFHSERHLAFVILISISNKLKGRPEQLSCENSGTFVSGFVSAICDQISALSRLIASRTESSVMEHELRSLLKLLLVLVENHPETGTFVLDKLHFVTETGVNSVNMTATVRSSETHKVVDAAADGSFSLQMFMFYIYKFIVAFLEILNEAGGATDQLVCKLKHLTSLVCKKNLFDCSTHTLYALLLHSHVNWGCVSSSSNNTGNLIGGLYTSPCKFLECEVLIHECAGNMLMGRDYWFAYRVGKYAVCDGMWYVGNFVFQCLQSRVESDICRQWLKFLVHFTYSEKNVQVLFQQMSHTGPEHFLVPSVFDVGEKDALRGYIEKFDDAYNNVSASYKSVEGISVQAHSLQFQKWFLALRVKTLHALADIVKLLVCVSGQMTKSNATDCQALSLKMKSMMSPLANFSLRLTRLAEEFDLLASSFVDLDSRSFKVISALAFNCSLLAFCTIFVSQISDSRIAGSLARNTNSSYYILVQSLAGRLWHTDAKICENLMSLCRGCGVHQNSVHLVPDVHVKVACIPEENLSIGRYGVEELIRLQRESLDDHNIDTALQGSKESMLILWNIVMAWTHVPFRIPKYFFRVRPPIGCELIPSSASSRKSDPIVITSGSHLALNLGIQLKNVPLEICSRISKIHSILYCKPSDDVTGYGVAGGEIHQSFQETATDLMIELNKKLQVYVMKRIREFMNWKDVNSDGNIVEECVTFETNGEAKGFTTCLLDVSEFPVGSYRIHWHSGFVDSHGAYWSLLPLNFGPVFSVRR